MTSKKHPLGIYIHIPFCDKKCDYCDFLSGPANNQTKEAYSKAIIEEIKAYKDLMDDYLVKTIFIGGGTPSSIEANYIVQILDSINKNFNLDVEEISIETNPGTLSREKLKSYKDVGINRLSIGLQSTNNQELKLLGRIHTYEEFLENYHLARELGYSNINIDLMSGLPGQSVEAWEESLQKVLALKPEHISAYSLIIEEGTPFYERYGDKNASDIDEENSRGNGNIDEETDRLLYSKTKEMLELHGYNRYEISNYARQGYECKHNKSYWDRIPYLGLGLGSSSLIDNTRYNNEENLRNYIKNSSKPSLLRKNLIILSKEEAMEEFMFLGLRLTKGISKSKFHQEFGIPIEEIFHKQINQSIKEGVLEEIADTIRLTDYGLDVSNHVLARFLLS
ncbi:MAG: oxygen-independent coproporphyrinogen III oxidase [Clostridiales bacterium]|nr:oxygen-independent coproporphyrinogen III oxidase [Clostridiales bacterium]